MINRIHTLQGSLIHRVLSAFISFSFILTLMIPPQAAAQIAPQTLLNLPAPGAMLPLSNGFNPAIIKGLKVDETNPLLFDFIVDHGEGELSKEAFRDEAERLVKYFLTSLTVPDQDLWVNLSPYEKDRIIPEDFGVTEMGRDMLAQDYLLKQLTASLVYPEDELGQKFWSNVYQKAQEQFGTTDVPVNTFNKVWIVPQSAVVWEHEGIVYVVERKLKVMLEEDYLALKANMNSTGFGMADNTKEQNEITSGISSEVVRDIVIPAIEKEVNEGEHFAKLRQIYNSMILAAWYKKNLKDSLLGQVYFDQNKVKGVDIEDREQKLKIYNQYLEAFKTGVFDYMREDVDAVSQDVVPRKYFSGGVVVGRIGDMLSVSSAVNAAGLEPAHLSMVQGSSAGSSNVKILTMEDTEPKLKERVASSSANPKPLSLEELEKELTEGITLRMSKVALQYYHGLYKKLFSPNTLKLRIAKHSEIDEALRDPNKLSEEAIIPSTYLSPELYEEENRFVQFSDIKGNDLFLKVAKQVSLEVIQMKGGLGTSFKRLRTLKRVLNGKRTKLADKATDTIFEDVLVKIKETGKEVRVNVSVAELKIIRYLKLARENTFGEIIIREMVNPESDKAVDSFYNQPFVLDVAEGREKPRTIRKVIEESKGIRLDNKDDWIMQDMQPTIQKSNKAQMYLPGLTAPGGHAFAGVHKLMELSSIGAGIQDDKFSIITNGDGVNNFVPEDVVGFMSVQELPIVVLTTDRTELDNKGGIIGLARKAKTWIIQLFEKAQAEIVGQDKGIFQEIGTKVKGDNNQAFNTNIPILNESKLAPFLHELRDKLGDEEFLDVIGPDLIQNEKVKSIDGIEGAQVEVYQIEGALVSSLVNLDSYLRTVDDPEILKIKAKHNIDKLLTFVNFNEKERTIVFTPVKVAMDHAVYATSDLYELAFRDGALNLDLRYSLPGFDLPDFYKDLENVYEATGKELRIKGLRLLRIDSMRFPRNEAPQDLKPVYFPNTRLSGRVRIRNHTGKDLHFKDHIEDFRREGLVDEDGLISLKDIIVTVTEDGYVGFEKYGEASSAVAPETKDVSKMSDADISARGVVLGLRLADMDSILEKEKAILSGSLKETFLSFYSFWVPAQDVEQEDVLRQRIFKIQGLSEEVKKFLNVSVISHTDIENLLDFIDQEIENSDVGESYYRRVLNNIESTVLENYEGALLVDSSSSSRWNSEELKWKSVDKLERMLTDLLDPDNLTDDLPKELMEGILSKLTVARETGSLNDVMRYLLEFESKEPSITFQTIARNAFKILAGGSVKALDDYVGSYQVSQFAIESVKRQIKNVDMRESVGVLLTEVATQVDAVGEKGIANELIMYLVNTYQNHENNVDGEVLGSVVFNLLRSLHGGYLGSLTFDLSEEAERRVQSLENELAEIRNSLIGDNGVTVSGISGYLADFLTEVEDLMNYSRKNGSVQELESFLKKQLGYDQGGPDFTVKVRSAVDAYFDLEAFVASLQDSVFNAEEKTSRTQFFNTVVSNIFSSISKDESSPEKINAFISRILILKEGAWSGLPFDFLKDSQGRIIIQEEVFKVRTFDNQQLFQDNFENQLIQAFASASSVIRPNLLLGDRVNALKAATQRLFEELEPADDTSAAAIEEFEDLERFVNNLNRGLETIDRKILFEAVMEFFANELKNRNPSDRNYKIINNARRLFLGILTKSLLESENLSLIPDRLSNLRKKLNSLVLTLDESEVGLSDFVEEMENAWGSLDDLVELLESTLDVVEVNKKDRNLKGVPMNALRILGGEEVELVNSTDNDAVQRRSQGSSEEILLKFYQDTSKAKGDSEGAEAEASSASSAVGGIDFNSELLDLQIKRDGKGVPLPVWEQPLEQMNIEGFVPVIINITPVSMPLLLGITDEGIEDPIKVSFKRGIDPIARHLDLMSA